MDNNGFVKDTPWQTNGDSGLHEECGVFGMYDFDGGDVASTIYYGLFALQHRGQESCGIAVSETNGPKGKVTSYKGMGLVNEVFTQDNLEPMHGDIGVGHVRYSTAGASTRENAQPLVLNYVKGTLALAHNGNLINAMELRKDLEYTGAIFQTTIDSEVIAYHIARERLNSNSVEEAVGRACQKIKGAFALVVMSPRKLVGARDPYGFKPLCIGKRDNAYILASETCALDTIGAEYVRDVLPGEIVTITPEGGIQSDLSLALPKEKEARCIFECLCIQDQGRTFPRHGFTGGCRPCRRCSGVRKCCSTRLFPAVGDSVWHCICEKRLCRKNFHQAETEQQRVQRAREIKCFKRGGRWKTYHYDR